MQGMVKIDTVVRSALADKGYDTLHLYPRYLHFALRGLRMINIDFSEDVKTVKIQVTKRKTVPYPDDYIVYNKLGVKVGDRLWCFVRDNTITSHLDNRYQANKKFVTEILPKISTYRFYNYIPDLDNSFQDYIDLNGYAHNGIGYFTPVDSCREFQLSSEVTAKEVILEYIATNYNPDTETYIPVILQDVISQYIHWQDSRFRANTPIGKTREEEREFLIELGNYNMRLSDLSYQGILDVSRRQSKLFIKG